MFGSPKQVVITKSATLLNYATVARTVGARCSVPSFVLWDQTEPRHSWGITILNSSWGERGVSPSPVTPQLSIYNPLKYQAVVTGQSWSSGT